MNEMVPAPVSATPVTDLIGLQRLLTWLSPAFPVGAFAWSGGLETAIADGRVIDAPGMHAWLDGLLHHGSLKSDAILLAAAHRAGNDAKTLSEVADLCLALIASAERHDETLTTGRSFIIAAGAWPAPVITALPDRSPYPVAVGAIAAAHGISAQATLTAFLTAAVHSQISVAVRLVPLGQTAGLAVMAELEPTILALAGIAAQSSLEDIGAIAYAADIAQMRHETLGSRIFRS